MHGSTLMAKANYRRVAFDIITCVSNQGLSYTCIKPRFDGFAYNERSGSVLDTAASVQYKCLQKYIGSVQSTESTFRSGFIKNIQFSFRFHSIIRFFVPVP